MKPNLWKSTLAIALVPALPAFAQALKVEKLASPAGANASQLNWGAAAGGNPILSWVEEAQDGSYSLRYAARQGAGWSEPHTVAAHRGFFHHPAELPEVISLGGSALMAHWIETPKEGEEAEFIYFSGSADGVHWTAPAVAHKDRSMVQHGLASMVATGPREASIVWLQALKGEDGPVSLMRTVVSADGKVVREEEIDNDVCECCPTAAVNTQRGILIAYRDHTPQNVRDIAIVRLENGRWSTPKTIAPDNWKITACPVNAASAAAAGGNTAVAWYTAAGQKPRVEAALSSDNGATFGKAATISTGEAYGYTSVAPDANGGAVISWLERGGGSARILVRTMAANGTLGPVAQVAAGEREALGYPRMIRAGDDVLIAWGRGQIAKLAK